LLIWGIGIFSEHLAKVYNNLLIIYPFIKKGYSLVCHQEESKLIYFNGLTTLLCARCTGIYLGLLTASFINIFIAIKKLPDIKFLFLFSAPMLTDVILYSIGLYNYSKVIAFATGLLFGSVGFLYFYGGVKDLLNEFYYRN